MIGCEDDNGIFSETGLFKVLDYATDLCIDEGREGIIMPDRLCPVVPGHRIGLGMAQYLPRPCCLCARPTIVRPLGNGDMAIQVIELYGRVVRRVWSPMIMPDEEWLACLTETVDEMDRVVCDPIVDGCLDRLIEDAIAQAVGSWPLLVYLVLKPVLGQIGLVVGIVESPVAMPWEILAFETHVLRQRWSVRRPIERGGAGPQVPFAAISTSIARCQQTSRQKLRSVCQLVHRTTQVMHVGANAIGMGIETSHHRCPGRAAQRACSVGRLEA